MQEASWVRSVYLYLMCVASVVLVGFGAIAFMLGLVHTIAPDLGHRDTLDRVGIGLANIASEVVDVVSEAEGGDSEEFCRDVTDTRRGLRRLHGRPGHRRRRDDRHPGRHR